MLVAEGYVAQEDNIQNFFLHFLDIEPIQRKKFRISEFYLEFLTLFVTFFLEALPQKIPCALKTL